MVAAFNVDSGDLEGLLTDLHRLPARTADRIASRISEEQTKVKQTAFRRAPKRTGFMASTIFTKVIQGPAEIVMLAGATADYTVYVHDGTSRMPPRPFLMDAMIAHTGSSSRLMRDIGKIMERLDT